MPLIPYGGQNVRLVAPRGDVFSESMPGQDHRAEAFLWASARNRLQAGTAYTKRQRFLPNGSLRLRCQGVSRGLL